MRKWVVIFSVTIAAIVIGVAALVIAGSNSSEEDDMTNQQGSSTEEPTSNMDANNDQGASSQAFSQTEKPNAGESVAVISTSMGDITVRLFEDQAPKTVANFMTLINQGKYVDVPVHRVIDDFMIQMGDFENGDGTGGYSAGGPGTALVDEFSPELKHLQGSVSMAKTAAPNSAGSQFFIVDAADGTPWLDGQHAVFGQVVSGMDVVARISASPTDPTDRPQSEVLLKSIELKPYKSGL